MNSTNTTKRPWQITFLAWWLIISSIIDIGGFFPYLSRMPLEDILRYTLYTFIPVIVILNFFIGVGFLKARQLAWYTALFLGMFIIVRNAAGILTSVVNSRFLPPMPNDPRFMSTAFIRTIIRIAVFAFLFNPDVLLYFKAKPLQKPFLIFQTIIIGIALTLLPAFIY